MPCHSVLELSLNACSRQEKINPCILTNGHLPVGRYKRVSTVLKASWGHFLKPMHTHLKPDIGCKPGHFWPTKSVDSWNYEITSKVISTVMSSSAAWRKKMYFSAWQYNFFFHKLSERCHIKRVSSSWGLPEAAEPQCGKQNHECFYGALELCQQSLTSVKEYFL